MNVHSAHHAILSRQAQRTQDLFGAQHITRRQQHCKHVSPFQKRQCCLCPGVQDEGSALLSALATALSNCRLTWPAFLPVHDPLRDACWGIGITGLGTIHYDSDSTHSSNMPDKLLQVQP